jgi:glucan 1,3-beta-glucosidase
VNSTFVCQANANGTQYFYFGESGRRLFESLGFSEVLYAEAFDEPWKEIYGGVEP